MNEDTKKVGLTEQDAKSEHLAEQDLDSVAGGGSENVRDIDVVVKKRPSGALDVNTPTAPAPPSSGI